MIWGNFVNFNDFRVVSVIFGAAVYLLLLVFVPLKTNFALKKAGKIVIPVGKKKIFIQILIMIFSALLIFFVWLRDLGALTDIVVCLVADLGCAMSMNEISMNRFCGLYENGLVGNGRFLTFGQILSVQDSELDSRILIVSTEKNSAEQFIFASEEEKNSIQKEILKRNPKLSR